MHKIITIGREFGSGGRELGRRLAEALGFEYYDNEIITEISKRTELSEKYVKQIVESDPHALFPITVGHTFAYLNSYALQNQQSVYMQQCSVIEDMAGKSDCVIVGRCADYILRESKPFRIFVYADMQSKIKRCRERGEGEESFSDRKLKKYIKSVDKNRARYYDFYTGLEWGDRLNYDLCINTSNVDIKSVVPALAKMFK